MEASAKIKDIKSCCKARTVLWYMVFLGFAVNTAIRLNLNIAIVSMVTPQRKTANHTIIISECLTTSQRSFNESEGDNYASSTTDSQLVDVTLSSAITNQPSSQTFDWDEEVQGIILGSYFYFNWLTQIPGGVWATKYGTKIVFGLGNLLGMLLNCAIPLFSLFGYRYIVALRILQGLITGVTWPSMHNMVAKWIPPNERSHFVSSYMGSAIGVGLTYIMCGFIIDRWGWEVSFYVTAAQGILWFICWWFLVYDTPAEHPRISREEREYIEGALGATVSRKEKLPIPWCKILTSVPLIMNILGQFGGLWGMFTLMNHSPVYLKVVFGKSATSIGFVTGLPNILKVGFAICFSYFADYLLKANKITVTNVRKFATWIALIGQALFILALSFSGCNYLAAVFCLTTALILHGTNTSGTMASLVDISPNFASISLGIANTAGAAVGALAAFTVGSLTYEDNQTEQWQKVFWICVGILTGTGFLYQLFSSSEIQEWNYPKKTCEEDSLIKDTLDHKTYNGITKEEKV